MRVIVLRYARGRMRIRVKEPCNEILSFVGHLTSRRVTLWRHVFTSRPPAIRHTHVKMIICKAMTEKHKSFVLVFTGMVSVCLAEYRKVMERHTGERRHWVRGDLLLLCLPPYACPYTPLVWRCLGLYLVFKSHAPIHATLDLKRNYWLQVVHHLEVFLQSTGPLLRTPPLLLCQKLLFFWFTGGCQLFKTLFS